MSNYYQKVREYLTDLDIQIVSEDENDQVFVIDKQEDGIVNLIIGCAEPILIMEQFMFEIKNESADLYKSLLKKNREILHGAFVVDETGKNVLYRNTLEIENLDFNEVEAALNSLSMLLSEFSEQLIKFSKQ